eukprot:365297-Chlamydomonas_euryale.AAC.13
MRACLQACKQEWQRAALDSSMQIRGTLRLGHGCIVTGGTTSGITSDVCSTRPVQGGLLTSIQGGLLTSIQGGLLTSIQGGLLTSIQGGLLTSIRRPHMAGSS